MVFLNGSRLEFNDLKQKLAVFSPDSLTQTLPETFNLVKCELYTTFLPRAVRDNALKETRQIASHKIHTLQLLILIKLFYFAMTKKSKDFC